MSTNDYTGAHGKATTTGTGPEVVFLSNPLTDPHWWTEDARTRLLEAGYTVTVLEPQAQSTHWRAVVDSVGVYTVERAAPVTLVGWSLGATIAQEVALAYPENVTSAVLLAPYSRQNEIDRIYQQCWELLDHADESLDPIRLALGLLTAFPAERLADDTLVSHMRQIQPEWASRPDPAKRRQAAEYIEGYQERLAALTGIQRPCLIVGFELDTDTYAARAREVADAIPSSRYIEIEGAGHLGPVTHPDEVWPVVQDFIHSHLPPTPPTRVAPT